MADKTKIDWAEASWNPVTGCLHGCEYCYARKLANRFGGWCYSYTNNESGCEGDCTDSDGKLHVLDEKPRDAYLGSIAPYPFYFDPTFHRYRLDIPKRWKRPRNIFVCSMADLFGNWIPDEWIDSVIKATQEARQHRYLFLTKNPERYGDWLERFEECAIQGLDVIEGCWFGASASNNDELERANRSRAIWLSIEPIRERIHTDEDQFTEFARHDASIEMKRWEWVVIGAETGNSRQKVVPKKEWVDEIAEVCRFYGTPIFMKESLRDLMGDDFKQEYPW